MGKVLVGVVTLKQQYIPITGTKIEKTQLVNATAATPWSQGAVAPSAGRHWMIHPLDCDAWINFDGTASEGNGFYAVKGIPLYLKVDRANKSPNILPVTAA